MPRRPLLPAADPWRFAAARVSLFVQIGAALAAIAFALLNPSILAATYFGISLAALRDLRLR